MTKSHRFKRLELKVRPPRVGQVFRLNSLYYQVLDVLPRIGYRNRWMVEIRRVRK